MGANLETFSYAMGGSVRQVKWPVPCASCSAKMHHLLQVEICQC